MSDFLLSDPSPAPRCSGELGTAQTGGLRSPRDQKLPKRRGQDSPSEGCGCIWSKGENLPETHNFVICFMTPDSGDGGAGWGVGVRGKPL